MEKGAPFRAHEENFVDEETSNSRERPMRLPSIVMGEGKLTVTSAEGVCPLAKVLKSSPPDEFSVTHVKEARPMVAVAAVYTPCGMLKVFMGEAVPFE